MGSRPGPTTYLWRTRQRPVAISSALPLAIIGQRLNPSNRPGLAAALRAGTMAPLQREALRQVEAGAAVLDVNAYLAPEPGYAPADEAEALCDAVRAVAAAVEVPLSLDSANP